MLCAMPSLRQSSAILASPRNPSRTMRIFSSAEYCRRVALRISRTVFSALSALAVRVLIVASFGVTMSPNLSLRQSTQSVPQVLTGDKGKKLYLYPEQYEGQECDQLIFCTGPVP